MSLSIWQRGVAKLAIRNVGLAMLAVAASSVFGTAANAAFTVPNSSTPPFQQWTRGVTANSYYAEWDLFNDDVPDVMGEPNTTGVQDTSGADVGNFNSGAPFTTPTVVASTAFITGGMNAGNIYSFAAVVAPDVNFANYGLGATWNTRVVIQTRTQATEIDPTSMKLTYDNGGSVTLDDIYSQELFRQQIFFGGSPTWLVDTLWVFDIDGFNPASLLLEFNALGSSMSLDKLAIDTYTTQSALAPVPEPTGIALAAVGGGLLLEVLRRRRRGVQARQLAKVN